MPKRKRYVDSIQLPDGLYYTAKGLAEKYGITENTVYKIKDKYKIKQQQIGGMIVIKDDDRFANSPAEVLPGFQKGADERRAKIINYTELVVKVEKLTTTLEEIKQILISQGAAQNKSAATLDKSAGTLDEILEVLTKPNAPAAPAGLNGAVQAASKN